MGRRDPLERIVDLVVAVPVSVVAAARQLVPFDTGPVERRVASLVGRNRELIVRYGAQRSPEVSTAREARREVPDAAAPVAPPLSAPDTPSSVAADDESLAIDGYDQLSARQIVDRLGELTPVELAAVARYERSNRRRQTVLGRIEQLS
jgi:hypothetical protein